MIKKYFLFFLIFFSSFLCFPIQENTFDNLLLDGAKAYSNGNYEQAILIFQKYILISNQSGKKESLSKAYNDLGNSYSKTGKSEKALKNYLLSIAVSNQRKDSLSIAKSYKNIGALYSEQKDFLAAMHYYENAFNLAKKIKNPALMADCLNNMGVIYEQQLKYSKALDAYSNALQIYKSQGDANKISMVFNNLAIVYKYLKNYSKSIQNYQAALQLSEKLNDRFMVAANQNNLGNVYALTGNYYKSLELCQLAYANASAIDAKEVIIESCDGIATAYEKLKQYPNAIKFRKLYELEKDNFINTQRSAQLAETLVKYETEKKINEIKLLHQKGKIKDLKIKEQNFQLERRNQLIIIFLLVLSGLISIGYFFKVKRKLKAQLVKEKIIWETEETERLRFARDIHDDLGSGLSKINFLSEIIFQKTTHLPEVKKNSEAIKETAIKMIENMRDLIWALNPENTTLDNLIARIREYTTDYIEDFPIELASSFPDILPQIAVSKESHHELFMVVKEILNNISRHSMATELFFGLDLTDDNMMITFKDNGIGFDCKTITYGNGLKNMKSRITTIGGKFEILCEKGEGTLVTISVFLKDIIKT